MCLKNETELVVWWRLWTDACDKCVPDGCSDDYAGFSVAPYTTMCQAVTCNYSGQKLCFGASSAGAGTYDWGFGYHCEMGCSDCCFYCDGLTHSF